MTDETHETQAVALPTLSNDQMTLCERLVMTPPTSLNALARRAMREGLAIGLAAHAQDANDAARLAAVTQLVDRAYAAQEHTIPVVRLMQALSATRARDSKSAERR